MSGYAKANAPQEGGRRYGPRALVSVAALVVFNLVPLAGVVYFGWSLFAVLLLYWIESGIVGILNLPKIALARKPFSESFRINDRRPGEHGKLFVLFFFPVHYGIFWVVHGVFVAVFFGFGFMPGVEPGTINGFEGFDPRGFGLAALGLLASHTLSFFVNFIGGKEYLNVSPDGQMFQPYGRVIVMHITILGGGWLIAYLGTPVAALALMVALKTAIDLAAHLREHRSRAREQAREAG